MKNVPQWAARVLTIIIILFFLLLSFDVFGGESQWYEVLAGFIVHNIPTIILGILLFVAWKKPYIGGSIFVGLGAISVYFFRTYRDPISFLIVSFPIMVAGLLFMFGSKPGS